MITIARSSISSQLVVWAGTTNRSVPKKIDAIIAFLHFTPAIFCGIVVGKSLKSLSLPKYLEFKMFEKLGKKSHIFCEGQT